MMRQNKLLNTSINTGSTADIAFLLLIFFLVATTIVQHKGLSLQLPPKQEDVKAKIKSRNLFKILINSNNDLLVQGEVRSDYLGIKEDVKKFILNEGKNSKLSESAEKAIISLKANRGTKYASFISVLDVLKGAYYEIYADKVGLTYKEFLELDLDNPNDRILYEKGRKGVPMNISIANSDQL